MRVVWLFLAVLLAVAPGAWAQDEMHHHHGMGEDEVGTVHFETSCDKRVEAAFNHAVALLHSFQYEDSRQAFAAVAAQDPTCAMAEWGVAMTHYHGLWGNGELAAGKVAWTKAAELASSNAKTTSRERAYIIAIGEVYQDDGKGRDAHAQAFAQKLAELHASYPNDVEAAIFYALALDITAPKTDKTYANQKKCGEILEPIFQKEPRHPGVAHYLIHCYDNPVLAEAGLPAARAYAKIAPASAHANHMPSHIFTRVGAWDESINSNKESAELAAQAEATSKDGEARDQRLHAMDYLEYAYLQTGQVSKAKSVLDEMNQLPPVPGLALAGNYATAAIPARFYVELSKWQEASMLHPPKGGAPWEQAITWQAIGEGGARADHLQRAAMAERELASLRDQSAKQGDSYWANQVEVQRKEVEAWIALASDSNGDALQAMRAAADLEDSMDKHPVTPGAVIPAREMLAEMLLQQNHPKESLGEYAAVLKVSPGRFNALYGAASAAEAAGDTKAAATYYRQLLDNAEANERPEVAAARKKAAMTAQK